MSGTIKGVDDFFAAGGTLDALLTVATTTEPDTEAADDAFSDARLADVIADEVLTDHYRWCKALGWLGWTGQRWSTVSEENVVEEIRKFAIDRVTQAVQNGNRPVIRGWMTMLKNQRLRAVLMLTRGIVECAADDCDADPDLLNTPTGVVDQRTAQLLPHDPDLLLTKITRGNYRPGFVHSDWIQALTAMPDDECRAWFQLRVGQAITGHPTPDGLIPFCQGSGENGKSLVLGDGIVGALGDYAAPCSAKLLASKHEHSTERADLRGQRFLIAEELTEDHALNVTALKQIRTAVSPSSDDRRGAADSSLSRGRARAVTLRYQQFTNATGCTWSCDDLGQEWLVEPAVCNTGSNPQSDWTSGYAGPSDARRRCAGEVSNLRPGTSETGTEETSTRSAIVSHGPCIWSVERPRTVSDRHRSRVCGPRTDMLNQGGRASGVRSIWCLGLEYGEDMPRQFVGCFPLSRSSYPARLPSLVHR
jgi:D5 N terminal like